MEDYSTIKERIGFQKIFSPLFPQAMSYISTGDFKEARRLFTNMVESKNEDTNSQVVKKIASEMLEIIDNMEVVFSEKAPHPIEKKVINIKVSDKLANMFPIAEEQYEALKKSIEEEGIKVPLILDAENNLLDGYTRLRIAEDLGYDRVPVVHTRKDRPVDPMRFAAVVNLYRRHLKAEQLVVFINDLFPPKKKGRPSLEDEKTTAIAVFSAKEMGAELGVSPRHAQKLRAAAKRIKEHPELAGKKPFAKETTEHIDRLLGLDRKEKKSSIEWYSDWEELGKEEEMLIAVKKWIKMTVYPLFSGKEFKKMRIGVRVEVAK